MKGGARQGRWAEGASGKEEGRRRPRRAKHLGHRPGPRPSSAGPKMSLRSWTTSSPTAGRVSDSRRVPSPLPANPCLPARGAGPGHLDPSLGRVVGGRVVAPARASECGEGPLRLPGKVRPPVQRDYFALPAAAPPSSTATDGRPAAARLASALPPRSLRSASGS